MFTVIRIDQNRASASQIRFFKAGTTNIDLFNKWWKIWDCENKETKWMKWFYRISFGFVFIIWIANSLYVSIYLNHQISFVVFANIYSSLLTLFGLSIMCSDYKIGSLIRINLLYNLLSDNSKMFIGHDGRKKRTNNWRLSEVYLEKIEYLYCQLFDCKSEEEKKKKNAVISFFEDIVQDNVK